MSSPQPIAVDDSHGWRAQLGLRFEARDGQTYLAERSHLGPLLIQRPFYPEGHPCHVYIVHPPGGIVGGDQLRMDVSCGVGSHVLLTTPAATKFYRSQGSVAAQRQELEVAGAAIEWLPQESIFYPGALAHCATHVRLTRDAKFIGWEIPCLGLPARNEPFASGTLSFDLELWVDGVPRFIDRLRIEGSAAARTAQWGLAGHEAVGTLLAYPANRTVIEAVRAITNLRAATTLVDEVLVCRGVGAQAEEIKHDFIRIWQTLRPLLLDRPAVMPRIWAT